MKTGAAGWCRGCSCGRSTPAAGVHRQWQAEGHARELGPLYQQDGDDTPEDIWRGLVALLSDESRRPASWFVSESTGSAARHRRTGRTA
jgi:hypothetical protein